MNKNRRKQIDKIIEKLTLMDSEIGAIKIEEESYYETMPESLQGSKRGRDSESAVAGLDEAQGNIVDAIENLNNAMGE